jgi:hypothetical protein
MSGKMDSDKEATVLLLAKLTINDLLLIWILLSKLGFLVIVLRESLLPDFTTSKLGLLVILLRESLLPLLPTGRRIVHV